MINEINVVKEAGRLEKKLRLFPLERLRLPGIVVNEILYW